IYGPAHAVKGLSNGKHASEQMQPYIRPLGEDIPWSSGPEDICASSPDHDRGLTGPVPTQVGRKSVWPLVSSIRSHLAWCGKASLFICQVKYLLLCLTSIISMTLPPLANRNEGARRLLRQL